LIGAELNSTMNFNPCLHISAQQPDNDVQLHQLASRLSEIQARISASHPSSEVQELKQHLSRKESEVQDLDKLLNDCVAENDVMFEQFNEEIVKMSDGFKVNKGEAELLEMLGQIREEQGQLQRENMCAFAQEW